MKLVSFSYNDYSWQLNDMNLQDVNLIVARNANGKSRTLSVIDSLVRIISQKREMVGGGTWKVCFRSLSGENYDYSVAAKTSGQITREVLAVDKKILIDRKISAARVFSKITNKIEVIFPPEKQLILHVRRDIKAYPAFEKLIDWALNSYGFRFGTISPTNAFVNSEYDFMNPVDDLFDIYRQLSNSQRDHILGQLRDMDYEVTAIKAILRTDSRLLEVTENGVSRPILHVNLSQGMFRVLALLVYFTYLINVKKPQLITIDDLGEGLDYKRSGKIGKFIFDTCKDRGIQLIATSNDGFLMDSIPIKYWNILQRKGINVEALNERNSPDLFKNFIFSGLSNFDFFSSDYIESHLK